MDYKNLMTSLGARFGLADLEPDEDGRYSIRIDETIVTFDELPQGGLMDAVARVGTLPLEGGCEICKILLTAMAPGEAAADFTFFISPDDNGIYLRRTDVLADLDLDGFCRTLEKYANALDEWRAAIGGFQSVLPVVNEAVERQKEERRSLDLNADGFLRA